MRPKIGLVCFVFEKLNSMVFLIQSGYVRSIIDAGGIPIIIPVTEDPQQCEAYVDMIDGLLVPGGEDMTAQFFGEEPHPTVNYINRDKDLYEMALIRRVMEQKKPIFGICRGLQIINVLAGGTLIQDIPSQVGSSICHSQSMEIRNEVTHKVFVEPGSILHEVMGREEIRTNSYHHQAIGELAPGFKVTGRAADGVIEAVESEDGKIFCVQWHPENLYKRFPEFAGLFRKLIDMSRH